MYWEAIFTYLIIWNFKSVYEVEGEHILLNRNHIFTNLFLSHGLFPMYINSVVTGGWFSGIIIIFYMIAPMAIRYIKNTSIVIKVVFMSLIVRIMVNGLKPALSINEITK